jgi:hypothetical protein
MIKNLFDYITEDANKANKKLENLYALAPNADRNRCPKSLKSTKHAREFMRGYFGEDENTAVDSVKTMLTSAGIDITNMSFEYGMYRDASGKYNVVKITSNDNIVNTEYGFKLNKNEYLYITNTALGTSKIRAKTLTPDNLGLTNDSYSNKEDIVNAVVNGLKKKGLEEYKGALVALCDCIQGGTKDLTLDEILNNTISYSVDRSVIGELTNFDFNNIANDFGEVLGPMMLMDKLAGEVVLSYPTGSNAKLFDYIINDNVWISAKAGKGAIPSSVDTMKAIQELYDKGNIDASGDEKDFLERIVPIIADDEKKESGSAIRRQSWRLALEVSEAGNINVTNALNVLKKYGLTVSETGILESDINKVYDAGDLENLLTEYYTALAYKPSAKYSISVLVDDFTNLDKNVKEGMILYPIKVAVTNYIDSKYSEYITKYANLVMVGYQMYFNHKIAGDVITLSFCPKMMSKGKFRLKAQGSVSTPLLKSMGIEMVK